MKEETYKKAQKIIEERDKLVEKALKIGEILANIDKDNDDSIAEFVKALLEIDEDHSVIWNIIEHVCEPLTKRCAELNEELANICLEAPEPINIDEQKWRVAKLIDEIEKLIGYKIHSVEVTRDKYERRKVEFRI
jgi:hypothetical protein